jgi:hypothetical protein
MRTQYNTTDDHKYEEAKNGLAAVAMLIIFAVIGLFITYAMTFSV